MNKNLDLFKEWVRTSLSAPAPFLNGMPPCPFAREAMVQNRFDLFKCEGDLESFVGARLDAFVDSGREAIIFVDAADYPAVPFEEAVLRLRGKYHLKDAWPLYDHPDLPEVQGDMVFNFKASALVIIQKLSGLVQASRDLEKRGYYKNWTPEYFQQVVGLREEAYVRMMDSAAASGAAVSDEISSASSENVFA
jgi:hypothetical protein